MRLLLSAADPAHPFRPNHAQRMLYSAKRPLPIAAKRAVPKLAEILADEVANQIDRS
jgi:hypothetical protein